MKAATAPRRKTVSTTTKTTTTTTTTTTAPPPEMIRALTERRTTSKPEAKAVTLMGKVENTVGELEWPFGGEGVAWVEVEDEEKQVKGSAVVEEEEEEVQVDVVTQPRLIFEDIFGFDK